MTGIRSPKTLASSDEVIGLEPDDEGLGNIRPDEVIGLEPDDEGLGNIRPDLGRVSSAG
jgi:hypothetical protein